MFSLEDRRLWKDLTKVNKYLISGSDAQWKGQEAMGTDWNTGNSVQTWEKLSLPLGWLSNSTGCLDGVSILGDISTNCGSKQHAPADPCFEEGAGVRWFSEVLIHISHSVIQWSDWSHKCFSITSKLQYAGKQNYLKAHSTTKLLLSFTVL